MMDIYEISRAEQKSMLTRRLHGYDQHDQHVWRWLNYNMDNRNKTLDALYLRIRPEYLNLAMPLIEPIAFQHAPGEIYHGKPIYAIDEGELLLVRLKKPLSIVVQELYSIGAVVKK